MSRSNGSSAWHQRSKTCVSSTPRQSRSRMPMGPANGHSRRLRPASASRARTACSSGRLAADADAAAAAELQADAGALALLDARATCAQSSCSREEPLERALGIHAPAEHAVARARVVDRIEHARWRRAASTPSSRSTIAHSSSLSRRFRFRTGFRAFTRRASVMSAPNSPAVSIHSMRRTRRVSSCSSLARGSAKCARHAVRQVLRLADVQERVVLAEEEIDAGAFRQLVGERRVELRRQARSAGQALHDRGEFFRGPLRARDAEELGEHARVAERAVARSAGDSMAVHHGIEAVAALVGRQRAREAHRAQHRRAKAPLEASELAAQETVVEARVVRDEQPALDPRGDVVGDGREWRRVRDHGLGDAGELLDGVRDPRARIHERRVFLDHDAVLEQDDARLDDPVARGMTARGLEVHAGDPACECAFSRGHRPASGAGRTGRAGGRGTRPRHVGNGGSRRGRRSR